MPNEWEWIAMPRYKLRKNLIRKILRKESLKDKKCLEIGYGAGDMLSMFENMGLCVDGYDFSPVARHAARNKISDKITLFQDECDIKKKSYDYLMAFEVLEHIQDDNTALKKFGSYLKDNGKLLLSVPAHTSKWGNNDFFSGHYRRYEKNELLTKLSVAGFNPILIWNYGYPLTLLLDPILHKANMQCIEYNEQISPETLSKESGIRRKKTIFNLIISSDIMLFPFYILQELFLNTDLSSGYIVYSEKEK